MAELLMLIKTLFQFASAKNNNNDNIFPTHSIIAKMKQIKVIIFLIFATLAFNAAASSAPSEAKEHKEGELDLKEVIFEHLSDRYGWEVPFCHGRTIHLPIIVWGHDGLHVFSSKRVIPVHEGHETVYPVYTDGNAQFTIAQDGPKKGKVVEIVNGTEEPVKDFSITKNVLAIWISVIVVLVMALSVRRFHKRNGMKAPRKGVGAIEALIVFIYDGVIKSTLGAKAKKFAPYLLTVFFFIFVSNLLGLMVVFPGGANLTGNIAITLTLAVMTFIVTNLFGTKHYWKDIFWPDVPLWLKFPIPIMPLIEIFGIFTKPAALTVRLFANMMGGHMIVIVLTLLIFIFAQMGAGVAAGTSVISVLFSLFMLLIDVLVSFIQAYVFTMLSTIFISLAQEEGHKHEEKKADEAEAHQIAREVVAEAVKAAD